VGWVLESHALPTELARHFNATIS